MTRGKKTAPDRTHQQPVWMEDPDLFRSCPIGASMGVLGRKWAANLLRDLAFSKNCHYHEFLAVNPGLSDRMLTLRLRELTREGFIERIHAKDGIRYHLTAKGEDMIPVLIALVRFGMLHHAHTVFRDTRPRELIEIDPTFWKIVLEFPRTKPTIAH